MRSILVGVIIGAAVLGGAVRAQQKPQDIELQAAIRTETITGDLKKAIAAYQAIVDKYAKTDRGAAADALVRMAGCYQKLGDQQATKLFERVLRDFSDQKQAVATASAKLGRAASAASGGMTNRQVWTGPDVDTLGTISPDGHYLSYTDWSTGDLAVRDLSTGTSRRLTDKGSWTQSSDFSEETTFSRDGSQIAYAWFNKNTDRYQVRILRTDAAPGTTPRVLFDNPDVVWIAPYDWSPDGKRLAVQLQRLDRTAQIGIISVSDGRYTPLKSIAWRGTTRMFFSPDGSLLAYDLPQPDSNVGRDVYLLSVDGTREITVAQHPANDRVVGWSPNGDVFLFASDRAGTIGLWSVPLVNGQPSGAPALIKPDIALESSLGITRRGLLAYAVRTGTSRVTVTAVDFHSGARLSEPAYPFETYLSRISRPDWSSDGKYVVTVEEMSPTRSTLTVRNVDGGRVRDLSTDMSYVLRSRWAPDGSITVEGVDVKGRQGVFRVDSHTGDLSPVVLSEPGMRVNQAWWTPDGKSLVYFRGQGDVGMVIVRNIQSGTDRLLIEQRDLFGPSLSPDGRSIAYLISDRANRTTTVYTMPLDGGRPTAVAKVPGLRRNFSAWTPDGRTIVCATFHDSEKPTSLWAVPAIGGTPQKLALDAYNGSIHVRVHPDGRIVYETGENAYEIWTLENFLPSGATTSSRR